MGGEDAFAEIFGEFFFEGVQLEVALHERTEGVAVGGRCRIYACDLFVYACDLTFDQGAFQIIYGEWHEFGKAFAFGRDMGVFGVDLAEAVA